MKEKPILFQGEMVRAILSRSKTQTRRIVKIDGEPLTRDSAWQWSPQVDSSGNYGPGDWWSVGNGYAFKCPYGREKDRLWVRETWADVNTCEGPAICYRADGAARTWEEFSETFGPDYGGGPSMDYDAYPGDYCMWIDDLLNGEPDHRWKPSIYMPRWASRITLEISDVLVERVQDISEEDAEAEGVFDTLPEDTNPLMMASDAFCLLWEDINGKKAGCSWEDNPWVWVVEFKRLEGSK